MDFKGEKEIKESSEQELRQHICTLLEEMYRMMRERRVELQEWNLCYKEAEETHLNSDSNDTAGDQDTTNKC